MTNNNHPLNADFEATVSTRRVGLLLQRLFQDPAWYEIAERLYRQTYSEAFVAYLSCRQQLLWDPQSTSRRIFWRPTWLRRRQRIAPSKTY